MAASSVYAGIVHRRRRRRVAMAAPLPYVAVPLPTVTAAPAVFAAGGRPRAGAALRLPQWLRLPRRAHLPPAGSRRSAAGSTVPALPPRLAQGEAVPDFLACNLTRQVPLHPVRGPGGHLYDRAAIEGFLQTTPFCPVTQQPMTAADLHEDRAAAEQLRQWRALCAEAAA